MDESSNIWRYRRGQLVATWVCLTLGAMAVLWRYEMAPGAVGAVPARLPEGSITTSSDGKYTLLLALHTHCPCSRATIRELSRIVARCGSQLRITAFVVCPSRMPRDWAQTDLWRDAAAVPNMTVRADPDGNQCRLLGAQTSGHAMLYGRGGELLFQGGITSERGHEGDNAGSDAIISAISNGVKNTSAPATTPVYGCPLEGSKQSPTACSVEGCSR